MKLGTTFRANWYESPMLGIVCPAPPTWDRLYGDERTQFWFTILTSDSEPGAVGCVYSYCGEKWGLSRSSVAPVNFVYTAADVRPAGIGQHNGALCITKAGELGLSLSDGTHGSIIRGLKTPPKWPRLALVMLTGPKTGKFVTPRVDSLRRAHDWTVTEKEITDDESESEMEHRAVGDL